MINIFNTRYFLTAQRQIGISVFLLLFLTSAFAKAQDIRKINYGKEEFAVFKMMENYHYKPGLMDMELSDRIYKLFIRHLDPDALYFTNVELNELFVWHSKLNDEIANCSVNFMDAATTLYKKSLHRTDSLTALILAKPMTFSKADTLFYRQSDTAVYSKDPAALEKRWNRYLKYSVLSALFTAADGKEGPDLKSKKTLDEQEPAMRAKVQKRIHERIKRILESPEGFENLVGSYFLNAIANAYDPHSEFFSPAGQANFESMISTEVNSFGLRLKQNSNGEYVIERLEPGGSAWKSNQLHAGDVIVKVRVGGKPEVELAAVSTGAVDDLFQSITTEETEFVLRSENGQVKSVKLVKTKMRSDENAVKGYILKGDKPFGYIALPSYYTETGSLNPLGCANDVAKEIFKLQEEHIQGLILDLRSSGGGSVYEAIALAGLFIDEGPLCIYKVRNGKPMLMKDMNRGTAYSGPLVVMVNGESASASELFVGIMKDYNRAMIVGSTTFGKATGQTVVPIDSICRYEELFSSKSRATKAEREQFGYVKVTVEKFYNLQNSTHQIKGVLPDIVLPEFLNLNAYKESSLPYALPNDSVVKKVVFHPLSALPVPELASLSKERLKTNKLFIRLAQLNDSLRIILKSDSFVILQPERFRKSEKKSAQLLAGLNALVTDSIGRFLVRNNQYEEGLLKMDAQSREINDATLKTLREDIFIEETGYILMDLIQREKN
jgi:carboxyl-terminal processing protease